MNCEKEGPKLLEMPSLNTCVLYQRSKMNFNSSCYCHVSWDTLYKIYRIKNYRRPSRPRPRRPGPGLRDGTWIYEIWDEYPPHDLVSSRPDN